MKPAHSFLAEKNSERRVQFRGKPGQPLTDYAYQTSSLGGAHSENEKTPPAQRRPSAVSFSKIHRDARSTFLAEAVIFAVLVLIAMFSFVICASELAQFLRGLALS